MLARVDCCEWQQFFLKSAYSSNTFCAARSDSFALPPYVATEFTSNQGMDTKPNKFAKKATTIMTAAIMKIFITLNILYLSLSGKSFNRFRSQDDYRQKYAQTWPGRGMGIFQIPGFPPSPKRLRRTSSVQVSRLGLKGFPLRQYYGGQACEQSGVSK